MELQRIRQPQLKLNHVSWMKNNFDCYFTEAVPIDSVSVLDQVIAWRRTGDKPLYVPISSKIYDAIWGH